MGYFWENSSWKELSSPGHRDEVTFLEGSKIPVDMALGVMVSGGLGSAGDSLIRWSERAFPYDSMIPPLKTLLLH